MIEKKAAKCDGINKAKGFKGCNEPSFNREHGLCPSCRWDFYHTDERGKIIYAKSFLPKVSKKVEQKQRLATAESKKAEKEKKRNSIAEKKVLREATTNYKNKLQVSVQKIARLIDKDLPCLARGIFGKMAGGHVFAKGGHAQMRFNLHNIHRQCFMSNGKSSDDGLLREKLEMEYGSEYLNFIKWLRQGDVPKLKDWEYRETHFSALKLIKRLETENRTYNLAERIELRNQVNVELGIYQPEFCEFQRTEIKIQNNYDKSA